MILQLVGAILATNESRSMMSLTYIFRHKNPYGMGLFSLAIL